MGKIFPFRQKVKVKLRKKNIDDAMHDSAHAMKSRTNWKQAAGNLRPAETLLK